MSTQKENETKEWKKARDAANDADMASSKALQDDALTSKDGKPADLEEE